MDEQEGSLRVMNGSDNARGEVVQCALAQGSESHENRLTPRCNSGAES